LLDVVDDEVELVTIDGGNDEAALEEGFVDGLADGEVELAIGVNGVECVAVVEELTESGVEGGDVGGVDEAFDFDGDFLSVSLGGEEAFGGEVDFKVYVVQGNFVGVGGDCPAFFEQSISDDIMKAIFCHAGLTRLLD
jgi:hypothetical protein